LLKKLSVPSQKTIRICSFKNQLHLSRGVAAALQTAANVLIYFYPSGFLEEWFIGAAY
jgi:hypothetical protein